ncbi:hypothetical protein KI809_15685 [Geobacter pelophilus]|uniref:Uncharacterized protein n=1 Tax=Geoanaerobacter pelophilus TaxID=60036 RepID=A0AAW4LBH8_9BACT|nr:hypothetical protein [Geoanaerobacter pelophilus]MBT0665751.1 hypothetical protein [Geoanaerobacter pelophilus]
MNVTLWQVVLILISFFGAVFTGAKLLLSQMDRRLDDRFNSLKEAAKAGDDAIHETLKQHINEESKNSGQLIELERQLLKWEARLPIDYVRREDFIRNQTVIESKLDGLALRLENTQNKGGGHA